MLDASLKALISTLPKNISKDISTSQCVSLFLFFLFYILLTTNKNLLQNTIHLISFLSVYHSQTLSYPFTSPLTSRLLFSMLIYISGIFHLSGTKKSSNSSVCKCFIFFFLFTWELNRSTIIKTKNIYKNFFFCKSSKKGGGRSERMISQWRRKEVEIFFLSFKHFQLFKSHTVTSLIM